jgi:hypothetical protein
MECKRAYDLTELIYIYEPNYLANGWSPLSKAQGDNRIQIEEIFPNREE